MKLTAEKAKTLASEAREKANKTRQQRVPEILNYVLDYVSERSTAGRYRCSFYDILTGRFTNVFSCDVELLKGELESLGFKCSVESFPGAGRVFTVSWCDD